MNKAPLIAVSNGNRIGEIQEKFNNLFPYLKLEFLTHNSTPDKNNYRNELPAEQKLYFEPYKPSSDLEIRDSMTVAELEKVFYDFFKWQVEILRKSGNVWLRTNFTNNWTLGRQNEIGRAIS